MDEEHESQHQNGAATRAHQVRAIEERDLTLVDDEGQPKEQAREEEEREQGKVIAADIPQLCLPQDRVLEFQRIEWVRGCEVVAHDSRHHEQQRKHREQQVTVPGCEALKQRNQHAAKGQTHHGDADHPVAVL